MLPLPGLGALLNKQTLRGGLLAGLDARGREKMHNQLARAVVSECPICHDLLDAPRITRCCHVFCASCIRTSLEVRACPACLRRSCHNNRALSAPRSPACAWCWAWAASAGGNKHSHPPNPARLKTSSSGGVQASERCPLCRKKVCTRDVFSLQQLGEPAAEAGTGAATCRALPLAAALAAGEGHLQWGAATSCSRVCLGPAAAAHGWHCESL